MLIPSTITARRTRRYTSTWYIHPTTHKHDFEPMDGSGRYIFQPPKVRQSIRPGGPLYLRLLHFQPRPLRLQPDHGPGRTQEAPHPGDQPGYVPHHPTHLRPVRRRQGDPGNHPHPEQRGHRQPQGKLWGKTSVHGILTNEAYTGTLVWGEGAKDKGEPVRVEKAFPAVVSKAQFRRVNQLMRSRAPRFSHPRRVGSSYLLSGLAKCQACNSPLTGRFAKSGQYAYYVCPTNIKVGKDACQTSNTQRPPFRGTGGQQDSAPTSSPRTASTTW